MKSVLLLCSVFLGISMAQNPENCPEVCDSCAEISASTCIAGEVVPDLCGCCMVCAKVSNEQCGGEYWSDGKCGRYYICVDNEASVKEVNITNNERGICKCRDVDQTVCGDDDVLYSSTCALNEASKRSVMAGGSSINKPENGGRCKYAPAINTPPKAMEVHAGQQVYLSCEIEGNPIPDVTWYRDGKKMPGYHNNVVVQVRGGPEKYHETSWVMIDSTIEDTGTYQCHASNKLGEINAEASLVVHPRPDVPEEEDEDEWTPKQL